MADAASQLVELLRDLQTKQGKPTPVQMFKAIDFVDTYVHQFNDAQKRAIREAFLDTCGLTPAELKNLFERGVARTNEKKETEDDFTSLLPKKNLLMTYVEHTSKTEWPAPFRAFSFLTTLGGLLGRQICVDRNVYQVWPNMVTLLVGPTGEGRKTTCAEFAMKIAREADEERFYQLGEKITSEAVHTALAERVPATGILYAPELSTVINKKDYTRSLINDLTRLWDCPTRLPVRTQSRGTEELQDVAVSFLACSNEEWLLKAIPEDAHKGGFFARMIQVYHPGVTALFSDPKPMDKARHQHILEQLIQTRRCVKSELTRAATLWFDKRYKQIRRTHFADPRMAAFNARRHDHLLRIGLLLAICESPTDTVYITDSHLQTADGLVSWVVKWLPKIYMLTGLTEVGEDTRRILYILMANGGRATRQWLLSQLYGRMSAMQVDDRLRTLKQAGFVKEVDGSIFEKPAIYYKILKHPDEETV